MDADPLLLPTDPSPSITAGHFDRRPSSGGWTAALFIIGVEVAERFAYYGVSLNLITYLTGPLRESTASAAAALNAWSGVASLLPLLGAFVADSYLGRYRTILAASLLYILSLGMLTLSSVLPSLRPPKCNDTMDLTACLPSEFQVAFFYFSLYLMAFAQGAHKPCVQAFGADQFDQNDPKELLSRSSFFNWWYFGMCGGIVIANLSLSYVQDNIGWGLGFGIPCVTMMIALFVFLLGTKIYRYYLLEDKSPFTRIGKTFMTLARRQSTHTNHLTTSSGDAEETCLHALEQSEFLHDHYHSYPVKDDLVQSVLQVDEAKGLLRLFPIWATCLMYGVAFAQSPTFFIKQASTMDRRIGPNFQVPPAALESVIAGTIVAFIPVYDRILVPIAKRFSSDPSGITMLQRIGTVIPLSLWWLIPQFALCGISEAFTMVGLQEFFYDQMPDALRSLGLALYLSIFGIGSFISSFLVSLIDKITSRMGGSWFSNNLNRGHLDYFYWLLTALSAIELVLYIYFAQFYVYKKKGNGSA